MYEAIADVKSRARLGDLLWSSKTGQKPHRRARTACDALVCLTTIDGWGSMDGTEGLVRALELSRELNDRELTAKVVNRAVEVVAAELGRDDRPGIAVVLLRSLADLPPAVQPPTLLSLVQEAATTYDADPHNLESCLELEVVLARSPAEQKESRVRQVELWRDTASKAQGIARASFLEKALDVARAHGLAELAKDLRVEIQALSEAELDLKTVSAEIKVDSAQLEQFHAAFVRIDSWKGSLSAFGAYGPTGGSRDDVERSVEKRMAEHPLQYLVHKVVINPDSGTPVFRANDDVTHRQAAIAEQRSMASQSWAMSAVTILDRFVVAYGRPTHEELTEYFESEVIDASMADRIAVAFGLWWDDRPDESAHLVVPRIEAAVRTMARQVGLPIIREPVRREARRSTPTRRAASSAEWELRVGGLARLSSSLAGRSARPQPTQRDCAWRPGAHRARRRRAAATRRSLRTAPRGQGSRGLELADYGDGVPVRS